MSRRAKQVIRLSDVEPTIYESQKEELWESMRGEVPETVDEALDFIIEFLHNIFQEDTESPSEEIPF